MYKQKINNILEEIVIMKAAILQNILNDVFKGKNDPHIKIRPSGDKQKPEHGWKYFLYCTRTPERFLSEAKGLWEIIL